VIELTCEDREVLRRSPISEEQFRAERESEIGEAARLKEDAATDGEGLNAADRALLRSNPWIDREAFIAERQREIAELKARPR